MSASIVGVDPMPPTLARQNNLLGMTCAELERLAVDCGQPRFRGRQIYQGIYARRVRDWAGFSDLNAKFREFLSAHHDVHYPQISREFVSRDGSIRYLLGLDDGESVEAVFMPEENRATLCISSQVGCAVDCRFCFTGILGVKRNLTAGEIVGQVLCLCVANHIPRRSHLNVVFMGMGEPLLNYAPVMKAVEILAHPAGMALALRHITISTSGIIPRIEDMARETARPHLAVSLNASSDEQRTALMPINRKYPLRELLRACQEYPLRPREKLTFEYVLLGGVNDSDADAARVADLVRPIPAKVNLIPYNSGPGLPYCSPPLGRVLAFQQVLAERRVPAFIRVSRGQDIMGACGQLRLAVTPDVAARS
ncbi:MAG TPA: 23S rRNA (adenine(2503)-C(2))-methyltransferase RlmN [Terriglobia bacterium]|nr:23S rRNA (adenine(2503)-C(2))-methyltransferase RlmN [Terriglobia bacterium]